ncbi:hypothetical protein pah_c197o092 [Parachlamydia acanthamoebae str. Hall's coccus]|nr:hypothetical protein pah_c197o092 [Parachlamydia acanthamoebae str. Hall's coccus]
MEWTPSISTIPELTELTRIFRWPSSLLKHFVIGSTAPLLAL